MDLFGSLSDFFNGIAEAFNSWYTDAVKSTITFLMASSLPSQKDVSSDLFKLNFGGVMGLALYFVTAMSIVVLLVFLLTPRRDHSMQVSRFVSSLIGLILYAVLFFRVYPYIDNASKSLMQFALNFITSSSDGTVEKINNMIGVTGPSAVGSVVVLGVFAVIFCWFAAAVAFGMKLLVFFILIIYPLLIVLRPLGTLAVNMFNAANSLLLVGILSPIIMVWAIALPVAARQFIPGADSLGITAIVTVVSSAGALIAPLFLLYVFFRLSSQVFGHVDTQGNTAITSMPALSWDEAQQEMKDNRLSPMKDSFAGVVGSVFEEKGISNLLSSIPDTLVTAGAAAATANFGPVAGAAVIGVHEKIKSRATANVTADSSQPIIVVQEGESVE